MRQDLLDTQCFANLNTSLPSARHPLSWWQSDGWEMAPYEPMNFAILFVRRG
jgi:hypothetical protein